MKTRLRVGDVASWVPDAETHFADRYKGFSAIYAGPFIVTNVDVEGSAHRDIQGRVQITTLSPPHEPVTRHNYGVDDRGDICWWWAGFFVTSKFLTAAYKATKENQCQKPNPSPSKTA